MWVVSRGKDRWGGSGFEYSGLLLTNKRVRATAIYAMTVALSDVECGDSARPLSSVDRLRKEITVEVDRSSRYMYPKICLGRSLEPP